ncbi:hypothetical protein Patl1_25968 [Pistacia atlantica]|uniref:Uncharacterized protein n=1 Tax=Pistacia atlantica TaxID=434234 RepID=A0ACC1B0Y2_9ROSI|nr:hypothetical protein Patl1_25968 [Pistacia atlantica]
MLIPRLLRAGAWMVKELSKDSYRCVSRTGCTLQLWRPLVSDLCFNDYMLASFF